MGFWRVIGKFCTLRCVKLLYFKKFCAVDKYQKSVIINIGSGKVTILSIDSPIEQRHTGKGNPNAILHFNISLNNRQSKLLECLSEYDASIIIDKKSVSMSDLSALTAKTGDEFALFTKGGKRLVIRGKPYMVNIDIERARELSALGYRWSGHTHPGDDTFCMFPSQGDKDILKQFNQKTSVIYNSKGQYSTFEKE